MALEKTTTYIFRIRCDKCEKTTNAAFTAPDVQKIARQDGWVYDFGKWDDLCEECYVKIVRELEAESIAQRNEDLEEYQTEQIKGLI